MSDAFPDLNQCVSLSSVSDPIIFGLSNVIGSGVAIGNPDWAVTRANGLMTVSTGDLRVANPGSNSASVVTLGGSQTLTNKTINGSTIGASSPGSGSFTTLTLSGTFNANVNGASLFTFAAYSDTASNGALAAFRHARGTSSSPTETQSGDTLSNLFFGGYRTDGFINSAAISLTAAENFATNVGTNMDFAIALTGTASRTSVLRLDAATGNVQATRSLHARSATAIPAGGAAGQGVLMSSTANFGIFFGSGAPTLSAAKGSLYLRSDGSTTNDRMYVNTDGSTGWTAVTTAS